MTDTAQLHAARQGAADLFAAAARRGDIPTDSRLHCLAAEQALGITGRPLPSRLDAVRTDEVIIRALRVLGALAPDDFDDPAVLAAARHGRHALRAQH